MTLPEQATLASLGERSLIEAIRGWLGPANPPPPAGIGCDCALLPATRRRALVTVDPVIRGRHFDEALPPRLVAEKLLKRNVSDIAAMGGRPTRAVIALAAPGDLPVAWRRDFYRGLGRSARRHGVAVVGGDCAQTDGFLGAFLTLIGTAPPRVLTRQGARPGDRLYVTGTLGGSPLGRHVRFTPRVGEGAWLARRRSVHAAIDLSDGLGKDLPAIVPAGLGAVVATDRLPVSRDGRLLARRDGRPVVDHVLNDGEDYELLAAVAPGAAAGLERAWRARFRTRLTCIGHLERAPAGAGGMLRFEPDLPPGVHPGGYEHFR